MGLRHGIVIVAPARSVRSTLGSWFGKAGYEIAVAATFAEAKNLLGLSPDLVVSELKLGEYNGLHLAAHAQSLGIPVIVIGPSDITLERDAEQLGALYLTSIRKQDLLDIVEHELSAHQNEHSATDNCRFLPARRSMMQFPIPGRSILSN
jgi:DNA-binding NtrC family response regulator